MKESKASELNQKTSENENPNMDKRIRIAYINMSQLLASFIWSIDKTL